MRRLMAVCLTIALAGSAAAATKDAGSTTLKDVQPAGTTDKKTHKHQQFDLMFTSAMGKDYTCRTNEKDKVKATDLPVGSSATYEVKGTKGKVTTAAGKSFNCTVMRVADAPAMKQ